MWMKQLQQIRFLPFPYLWGSTISIASSGLEGKKPQNPNTKASCPHFSQQLQEWRTLQWSVPLYKELMDRERANDKKGSLGINFAEVGERTKTKQKENKGKKK